MTYNQRSGIERTPRYVAGRGSAFYAESDPSVVVVQVRCRGCNALLGEAQTFTKGDKPFLPTTFSRFAKKIDRSRKGQQILEVTLVPGLVIQQLQRDGLTAYGPTKEYRLKGVENAHRGGKHERVAPPFVLYCGAPGCHRRHEVKELLEENSNVAAEP